MDLYTLNHTLHCYCILQKSLWF